MRRRTDVREMGEVLMTAAGTLPLWRDLAIVILAGIAILGLWLFASVYDK
jgi:hypothetical protein